MPVSLGWYAFRSTFYHVVICIKHQGAVGGVECGVVHLKIQQARHHIGYACQQILHHDRCIQQPHQRRAPRCYIHRSTAMVVNGHIEEDTGHLLVVLHQGDATGDGGKARVYRLLCACAAQGLGAKVQPLHTHVLQGRLNLLDEVQVVVGCVSQLAHRKSWRTVGPYHRQKSMQVSLFDVLNKTETLHTRELLRQIARGNIGGEVSPADLGLHGVHAPQPVKTVNGFVKPCGHLLRRAIAQALKLSLGLVRNVLIRPLGRQGGQPHAQHEHQNKPCA